MSEPMIGFWLHAGMCAYFGMETVTSKYAWMRVFCFLILAANVYGIMRIFGWVY